MSKVKKILITYLNNGDIKNKVESEVMWNQIMKDYSELTKSKESTSFKKKMVEFVDGTVVEMMPIDSISGYRATHVFASDSLDKLIPLALQSVLPEGVYSRYDTEGKSNLDRFVLFGIHDGKLLIQKL